MARSYMSAVKNKLGVIRNIEVQANRERDARALVKQAIEDLWPEDTDWDVEVVARLKKQGTPVKPVPLSTLGDVVVYSKQLKGKSYSYSRKSGGQQTAVTDLKPAPKKTTKAKKKAKKSKTTYIYGTWAEADDMFTYDVLSALIEPNTGVSIDRMFNKFPLELKEDKEDAK